MNHYIHGSLLPLLCTLLVQISAHTRVSQKDAVPFHSLNTDSEEVQIIIVNLHNNVRRKVQPPAADMQKMAWSKVLADMAKKWAEKCYLNHSMQHERMLNDNPCGENIVVSKIPLLWSAVIKIWDKEKENFVFSVGTKNGTITGHYTQLISSNTFQCGCAVSKCLKDNKYEYFYVCLYYTAGNREDKLNEPYTSGKWCSRCEKACDGNKLCTNSCLEPDKYINCQSAIFFELCDDPYIMEICYETCQCSFGKK